MNLSKNQIVMLSIGGVSLAASLALGYLAYDAWSAKSELEEEIESEGAAVRRLLGADVSPDGASVTEVNRNRDTVAGWCEAALAAASSGDAAFSTNETPSAVKQRIVDDARELAKLPDGKGGLVKPDFGFGFPEFVTGEKLPEKARIGQIQRQWHDVRLLVRTLAECGVAEVTDVKVVQEQKSAEEEAQAQKKQRGRPKKSAEKEKPAYTSERYSLGFLADGSALVRVANALATSQRFVVVDSFDFERKEDRIAAAIGVEDKKDSSSARRAGRGRGRRGADASADAGAFGASGDGEKEAVVRRWAVCAPGEMPPFSVKATVTVYDFGTAELKAAKEKKEEER